MQIREHALATPDKPAVILYPSGTVVTFGEMEARANQLAHLFRQAGLREGDAVAMLMENNEHFHTVMWAARRSGLYYVPINTHLTAAEAAYIIDNSAAKAIVGTAAMRPVLEGLAEHLPKGLPPLLITADGAASSATDTSSDLDGWLRYRNALPINRLHRSTTRSRVICCSTRRHHRPAQGHQAGAAASAAVGGAGLMTMLVSFWMNPEGSISVPHRCITPRPRCGR